MGRPIDPGFSRAIRRAEKSRMKKKAIKVYHFLDPHYAIRLADHLKTCSLPWCCGNPRLLGHRKRQEQRAALRARDEE